MSIAIDNIYLLFLLVAASLYLFGMGWLFLIIAAPEARKYASYNIPGSIAAVFAIGITVNYGIVIVFQRLSLAIASCGILAAAGCLLFMHSVFPKRELWISLRDVKIIGSGITCIMLLAPIFANPIGDWDARSIWFFHAKMMYYADTIGLEAGWNHPSVFFIHADYPKLFPALAAQIASTAGFWNEFLPKTAILLLLLPAILWIWSFAQMQFDFVLLSALFISGLSNFLWNGYVDGYIGLYSALGLLLFNRFVESQNPIDGLSALICILLPLHIKNEGLFSACISVLVIGVLYRKSILASWKSVFSSSVIILILIMIVPFIVWKWYLWQWNITNDLKIGSEQSLERIMTRLQDDSLIIITRTLFDQVKMALLFSLLAALPVVAYQRQIVWGIWMSGMAAILYFAGIAIVYLLTPQDLVWHLATSADRTVLPVSFHLYVVAFLCLRCARPSAMHVSPGKTQS